MKTTIPALPPVAEYGSPVAKANPSRRATLETKPAFICGKVRQVELASVSPGYVPAGSALRLQSSPAWSVQWNDGRADHGRTFATETEAREHFATYPSPPVNRGRVLDHLAAGGKAWLDLPGKGSFPLWSPGDGAIEPADDDRGEPAARALANCRGGVPVTGSFRLA